MTSRMVDFRRETARKPGDWGGNEGVAPPHRRGGHQRAPRQPGVSPVGTGAYGLAEGTLGELRALAGKGDGTLEDVFLDIVSEGENQDGQQDGLPRAEADAA